MKKIFALMLAVLSVLSVSLLFANADATADVYVTISDKDGKLALAYEKVTVTDIDGDDALTINDALYAAHEKFYDGGAKAGYATEITKYGLSLTKLWGTANGYSYGYMVNDASAWSMTDPVKADDYVAAYVFTDTKNYADKYAYFDVKEVKGKESDELTLTLKKNDFDADWNPVTLPVVGAELTVNGKATGIKTDENGQATLTLASGKSLISATAADQVIVPPVCLAEAASLATDDEVTPTEAPADVVDPTDIATSDEAGTPTEQASDTATKDTATKDNATKDNAVKTTASSSSPKTGDSTHLYLWMLLTAFCLSGIVSAAVFYKKHYAK